MINPSEYPDNYDNLSENFQVKTLKWFNNRQRAIQKAQEMQRTFVQDIAKNGREREKALYAEMRAVKDYLSKVGIKVEYNWTGHRREWFFATYYDAEMEDDWHSQCADYEYDN